MTTSRFSFGRSGFRVSISIADLPSRVRERNILRVRERDDAPLVVPDWEILEHALHRHLFHYFLRRTLLVNNPELRPRCNRIALRSQRAHEWDIKHTKRARRELPHDVRANARLTQWVELDGRKLVPIPREEVYIRNRVQRGEQRGLFGGVSGPRVDLGIVRPERGEGNRRDDKFERRGLIDLER